MGFCTPIIPICVGKTTQDITTTEVNTGLNNLIQTTNESFLNIVNDQVTKLTTDLVNTTVNESQTSCNAANVQDIYNITVKNGATFDISQLVDFHCNVTAISNISQNDDIMTDLMTKVSQAAQQELANKSDLQNDVAAMTTLTKNTQSDGEINNAINQLSSTVQSAINSLSNTDKSSSTKINTTVDNTVIQTNKTSQNIKDIIESAFSTNVTNNSISKCLNNNKAFNSATVSNITLDGKGSTFNDIQKSILNSFYDCVLTSSMSVTDLQKLASNFNTSAASSSTNDTSIFNKVTASISQLFSNIAKSFADNIQIIIIVVVIAAVAGAFILFGLPLLKGKNVSISKKGLAVGADAPAQLNKAVKFFLLSKLNN
jgi:hypothetical protein